MADRYWVGTTSDWHTSANWASTSGGSGGAGVPTVSDDVYFDSNGQATVSASTAIACVNFTLESDSSHIFCLVAQGGLISGDFTQSEGYFGPYGGGGYILEIQGDLLYNGGSFSVGTGTGVDPTIKLSGTNKSVTNNSTNTISLQNLEVSGTILTNGTHLVVFSVAQSIKITGTLEIYGNGATINEIRIDGLYGSFSSFTGTITGGGRFTWIYRVSSSMPTTGTIECTYFRFKAKDGLAEDSMNEVLKVTGWTDINNDWSHIGTEPWIDTSDSDTSYISIDNEATIGDYDEYYELSNLPSPYITATPSLAKIGVSARLYAGSGGSATTILIELNVWDGVSWNAAGYIVLNSTSYTYILGSNLTSILDTKAKINAARIKFSLAAVVGGGADKGGVRVSYACLELEGTIEVYPEFYIAARTWDARAVEFIYTDDKQTFQLGVGTHIFNNDIDIDEVNATITEAHFDLATYNAELRVYGNFELEAVSAFPVAEVTFSLGDGTHIFRGSFKIHFNYTAGTSAELIVNAGQGTLIFWPPISIGPIITQTQYRLSRVHNTPGSDFQAYNRIILFNKFDEIGRGRFIEGFGANELIIEGTSTGAWYFRRYISVPVMEYEVNNLNITGLYGYTGPLIRGVLALSTPDFNINVSGDHDIFNCRLSFCDASAGNNLLTYNAIITSCTNVEQHDRDVRVVGSQRNRLISKKKLVNRPPNEVIVEQILETL